MCARIEIWLPIVPDKTRRAAAWPVRRAMWDSRDMVVGSSAKTSSRRVVCWMERSMEGVGVVTTSPGGLCEWIRPEKGGHGVLWWSGWEEAYCGSRRRRDQERTRRLVPALERYGCR